jgi:hypothetical protein
VCCRCIRYFQQGGIESGIAEGTSIAIGGGDAVSHSATITGIGFHGDTHHIRIEVGTFLSLDDVTISGGGGEFGSGD